MTDKIDTSTARINELLEGTTKTPWSACNMVHADRGDQMTPEEIGEYVCEAVKAGDPSRFLFLGGQHDDGTDCDIAHFGNGPRGPYNLRFIAAARVLLPLVAAERDTLAAEVAELRATIDNLKNAAS